MVFDTDGARVAGSSKMLLKDPAVAEIYGLFGDKCQFAYGFDIREKHSFMSSGILRQVQSFVNEYGVEDSKRIIERLFEEPYRGNHNGQTVGTSIFSKGFRWLANKLLMEKAGQENIGTSGWSRQWTTSDRVVPGDESNNQSGGCGAAVPNLPRHTEVAPTGMPIVRKEQRIIDRWSSQS